MLLETERLVLHGWTMDQLPDSLKVLRAIGMRETHETFYEGMDCRFHVLHKPA